ncbi:MAG: hypothetical protein NW226_06345 [Microscillaceae bacterium]|nr:hypothetical protein [Microscillaceae bacterium]
MIRKSFFLTLIALISLCLSYANARTGLTVIAHGFTPGGKISSEWTNFAKAIRKRAGKGSIFINDTQTGLWTPLDAENTNNPNDEVILVYDWAWASDNLKEGYLEACADHLFAILMAPPKELNLTDSKALLQRPKHFIGHSRGAILLTQVAHRLGYFFNNTISIDQMTLLDPHPAAPMGDCQLPGIVGTCPPPKNYAPQTLQIHLPQNVFRVDNYYRQDGVYEDVITDKVFGPYDGIPVMGITYNKVLNNETLTKGSTKMGGAHASIGTRWYYGTIDFENTFAHPINEEWYAQDSQYPAMGPKEKTGFYNSRLGGGPLPPLVPNTAKIKPMAPFNLIYNGLFDIERDLWKGNIPGWEKNGAGGGGNLQRDKSGNSALRLERSKINLRLNQDKQDFSRNHSIHYLPENFAGKDYYISLKYRVVNDVEGSNQLEVSFDQIDRQGNRTNVIIGQNITLDNSMTTWKEARLEVPRSIKGSVGSLRLTLLGDKNNRIVEIDEIRILAK